MSLNLIPDEILLDIFARNIDEHKCFAEKVKNVNKRFNNLVTCRGLNLIDVQSVEISAEGQVTAQNNQINALRANVHFKAGKDFNMHRKVEDESTSYESLKRMLEIVFNKVNSLEHLTLKGMEISKDLIDYLGQLPIDFEKINTVVMESCSFTSSYAELCEFLRKFNLNTFKLQDGVFPAEFVTNELLRIAKLDNFIGSKDRIVCPNVTNEVLNQVMATENHPERCRFQVDMIHPGYYIRDVYIVMEALRNNPEVTKIDWSFGVLPYGPDNEVDLLRMQQDRNYESKIKDDRGMRMYTMVLRNAHDAHHAENRERKFEFTWWMPI